MRWMWILLNRFFNQPYLTWVGSDEDGFVIDEYYLCPITGERYFTQRRPRKV